MAAKLPPFIVWRDGRPRFIPGARERGLGFKGEDLRHDGATGPRTGAWFSFEQAAAWGEAKHRDVLVARASGRRIRKPAAPRARTVEALLDEFLAAIQAERDRALARGRKPALTQEAIDSYAKTARAVVFTPEPRAAAADRRARAAAAELLGQPAPQRARELFATTSVTAIGPPELRDFYAYAKDARGHHMAIGMISVISAAWTWGRESTAWRLPANPRHDMQFDRPDGRVHLIALERFVQLVCAADLIGMPSIGDAFYLGLWTGQRQTDRLGLVDAGLEAGRRRLKQSKTGEIINIKEAPALAARLAAARARAAAIALRLGRRSRPDTIVVDEATGEPYNGTTYRHRYGEVRAAAVAGIKAPDGSWALAPMPACADDRDQDLRDTCVILLHRSGCGPLEICDITGHSYASIQTIIKHYLGRDATRADAAIDKLADFVARSGSAV
jgi:hypothetical protein